MEGFGKNQIKPNLAQPWSFYVVYDVYPVYPHEFLAGLAGKSPLKQYWNKSTQMVDVPVAIDVEDVYDFGLRTNENHDAS